MPDNTAPRTTWVYKATPAKASLDETRDFAHRDRFLARSLYTRGQARSSHTAQVQAGDVIHIYYRDKNGGVGVIGTFEVDAPTRDSKKWRGPVEGSSLVEVTDTALKSLLRMMGYEPDPERGVYTGWALIPRDDLEAPAYSDDMFPGRHSLRPFT